MMNVGLLEMMRKTINLFSKVNESEIIYAAAKVKSKVAGCDINKNYTPERQREFGSIKKHYDDISKREEEREIVMGGKIERFVGERKKANPIIVIVGKNHTNPESAIFPVLDNAGIHYKVLRQWSPKRTFLNRKTHMDSLYGYIITKDYSKEST